MVFIFVSKKGLKVIIKELKVDCLIYIDMNLDIWDFCLFNLILFVLF